MKRKNIILVMLLVLSGLFALQSCKEEDNTTFTTQQAFTQPVGVTSPVVREDGTVLFTGSTVDLKWASVNTGGDPVKWDVYFGTAERPALVKTGLTVNTWTVTVVDGQTYYWKVEIKDSRGLVTSSETFKFIAVNGSNQTMKMNLTTTTDVLSSIGVDLVADDVVDLQLLILNSTTKAILNTIDLGGADEGYNKWDTKADGTYIIAASIFGAANFGAIDAPVSLSLNLKFFQLGMIDQTLEFPVVMTNKFPACTKYRMELATVTKLGAVYTITRTLASWSDPTLANPASLAGTWLGYDADDDGTVPVPYASEITATYSGGNLIFTGIGRGWMTGWWGEVIITETPVIGVPNFTTGKITIALQPIMTTTYGGAPQPAYSIASGEKGVAAGAHTGTKGSYFTMGCAYPYIHLQYDFQQGTDWICNKYSANWYFWSADITLDPAGLKAFMEDYQKAQVAKGSVPAHPSR